MKQGIILRLLRGLGLAALAGFVTAANCDKDIGQGDQPGVYTVRVSTDATGGETAGTSLTAGGSTAPSISGNGRFVAFQSDAVDLVVGDGNGYQDIFVKDRTSGAVDLVSFNSDAQAPSGNVSSNPSLSQDGRFVAFESLARLAVGQTPAAGQPHVYVHDRSGRTTRRIFGGLVPAGGYMVNPSISADGRYVAFVSNIDNMYLTPPAAYTITAIQQVYVSDLSTTPPTIVLVSRTAASATAGGGNNSSSPRISADGTTVVFQSDAADLLPAAADSNGARDVFAGTPSGAVCTRVSVRDGLPGAQTDFFSQSPAVSGDGRFVAFMTLDSVIGSGSQVIAVRDRTAGTTTAVSQNPAGGFVVQAETPGISDDGQTVTFVGNSAAGGLTFIWTRNLSGSAQIASVHLSGALAGANCSRPSLSGDGRWVAWETPAANLITTDSNGQNDIFVRGPLR